jgi:hypothetical protein
MTSQQWSILVSGESTDRERFLIPLVAGTLSGTVQTGVTANVNYLVQLYYRPNMTLLEETRTSSTGAFSFSFPLNQNEGAAYTIIAFDLTKTYNAIVYDLLTPG